MKPSPVWAPRWRALRDASPQTVGADPEKGGGPGEGDSRLSLLYFDSDGEQTSALLEGAVDAVAGDEFDNRFTARDTPGLRVTAIVESNERGAFRAIPTRPPATPCGRP